MPTWRRFGMPVEIPLTDNGLSIIQAPTTQGPRVTVTTILLHESGQFAVNELEMLSASALPQAIVSTVTYGRRCALAAVAGVAPEDDDGQAGMERDGETRGREEAPPKPAQRKSQTDGSKRSQASQPPYATESEPPWPEPPPLADTDLMPRVYSKPATTPDPTQTVEHEKKTNPVLHIGVITTVEEQPLVAGNTPKAVVKLDTGFAAGAKGKDFIASAIRLRDAKTRVELVTEPSKMGANYFPNILEMLPRPNVEA